MNKGFKALAIISFLMLTACVKIDSTQNVLVNSNCRWGIVTFTNNTEIPQAGYKAMSITSGVLRAKGVRFLTFFPYNLSCSKLITCPNAVPNVRKVLFWAHKRHLTYVMVGSVNEWDYKVGLDGEPAVGLTINLYHVPSGNLVWSSVGSKIGTSRSGLAVTAQGLITRMLYTLKTV